MSILAGLRAIGAAPAVLEGSRRRSGLELANEVDDLVARIHQSPGGSLLVSSNTASRIVVAIAAAEAASGVAWLAPATIETDALNALVEHHGLSLRWTDDLERPESAVPVSVSASMERGGPGLVLMTSGTTGSPKLVRHRLASVHATIRAGEPRRRARWLLTYPPTSFAGIQVLLTAVRGGGVLVSPAQTAPVAVAETALASMVDHVSGTPTFWRALLLALGDRKLDLVQATLGGEAVDQILLNRLGETYPSARIVHIYATTELGVLFSVSDRREGFPAVWLDRAPGGVELRVNAGVLEVRSPRRMVSYLSPGGDGPDADGWFRTQDLVRVEGDRVLFEGRADRLLNTGGFKVRPEEVEAVLLGHSAVAECRVHGVRSPITGELVAAEVVLSDDRNAEEVRKALGSWCFARLEPFKVPRVFRFVSSIGTAESGKKIRD